MLTILSLLMERHYIILFMFYVNQKNSKFLRNMKRRKRKQKKIIIIISATVAIIVAIIISLILLIPKFTSNGNKELAQNEIPYTAVSENNSPSENVTATASENNAETAPEPEEISEPEVFYEDLSKEEAWEMAVSNNKIMRVTEGNVNVRAHATTDSEKLGTCFNGSTLYIVGEKDMPDGYTWCYVVYETPASMTEQDNHGNVMFVVQNTHNYGYIRKDLMSAVN